ncbi:MAG: DUF4215 domain-containing protein [Myxococcota bacterium]|nr:DUF4215 domain-containing protein [Myxococcota bacterium]
MTGRGRTHLVFAVSLFMAACGSDEESTMDANGDAGGSTGMTGGASDIPSTCGDGEVQVGEACDDGNDVDTDGCLKTCQKARCGDGLIRTDIADGEPGYEACDDGNDNDNDGCRNNCRIARCGDGAVHAEVEACDDGNGVETDGCLNNCQLASCGDGVIQLNVEECDDQNFDDTDACTNACLRARCGDGVVFAGTEACDDGNQVSTDACLNDCTVARCGDGQVYVGVEDCDDGNDDDGDGCRNDCTGASCGDGIVQAGEDCDDGNDNNGDACRNDCVAARCGDGVIHEGVEACDDGNDDGTDGCTNTCTVAICGDGVVRTDLEPDDPGYEVCDDGNLVDEDECPTTCERARCGDGFVHIGIEECDDANDSNEDDCVERVIGGEVRGCFAATCGDGYVNGTPVPGSDGGEPRPTELCDDGNRENGDDCPTTCRPARCGDAFVRTIADNPDDLEECDDGNDIETDACRTACVRATCGDGIVWAGVEECDDANNDNRDGCVKICLDEAPPSDLIDGLPRDGVCLAFACRRARCGDGIRRNDRDVGADGYEECDDGDGDDRDGCTNACQQARCGDGIRRDDAAIGSREFEACDDGNTNNNDNCLNTCAFAGCGDGIVNTSMRNGQVAEECDDGNENDQDGCTQACRTAVCGDGLHRQDLQPDEEGYEACDDGNENENDDCLNACILARCGDGVVNRTLRPDGSPIEVCDDGNRSDNDHCRANCEPNICGDGIVNEALTEPDDGSLASPTEQCDDQNDSNLDGCLNTCTLARCGDGIRRTDVDVGEPGYEECDDGNDDKTDGCLVVIDDAGQSSCIRAVCGDGVQRLDVPFGSPGYEPCDDGNDASDDGCLRRCIQASPGATLVDGIAVGGSCATWQCELARCGDGFRRRDLAIGASGYEFCDDGNTSNTDVCLTTCEPARCGDGFILAGLEECDDRNANDTDDCRNDCTAAYCGDGVKAGTEACDDGNQLDDDDCVNCVRAFCGDGVVRQFSENPADNEECDYNQVGMSNQCLRTCRLNVCGDGVIYDGVEECDDGANGMTDDGCMDNCVSAYCGDGLVHVGVEQCDDGNVINGDGCESDCTTCAATYFNGSAYAYIEKPRNLTVMPPFTIEFWLKWERVDPQANRFVTVLAYGAQVKTFQFRIDQRDGLIYFENDDVANGPSGQIFEGQWHHIAATRSDRANGYRDVLFVDGKEVASQDYGGQPPMDFRNPHPPLFIGADSDGQGAFHFTGYLRQLRLTRATAYVGPFTPPWRYDPNQNADTWPLTEVSDGLSAALAENENSPPLDFKFEGASIKPVACGLGTCGDGRLDVAEECDDGNLDEQDGCNVFCETQCASLVFGRGTGWVTHESLGAMLDGSTEGKMEIWVDVSALPDETVTVIGAACDGPRVDVQPDGRLQLVAGEATCTTDEPVMDVEGSYQHIAVTFQTGQPRAAVFVNGTRICDLQDQAVQMDLAAAGPVVFGTSLAACPLTGADAEVMRSIRGRVGPVRVSKTRGEVDGRVSVEAEFQSDANTLFAANLHDPIQNNLIRSIDNDARASRVWATRRDLFGPACGGCGDGIPQAGEQCDDGNEANDDDCLVTCERPRCGDGFYRPAEEDCDDGNNESGDGCDAQCVREAVRWAAELPPLPYAQRASQVAFDGTGLMVVGGDGGGDCQASPETAVLNRSARLTNGAWVELSVANGPTAVADGLLVHDPSSGYTVMFGGYNRCTQLYSRETLLWDGQRWDVHIKPTPASLTARAGMAATYDAAQQRIVMFGGRDGQTSFNETWIWTFEAGWVQLFGPTRPGARDGASLAFDPVDQSLILYGGSTDEVTWRFAQDTWTAVATNVQPPSRTGARLVSDPIRNELVLFGGHAPDAPDQLFADTWLWKGGQWREELDAGGLLPSARAQFGWAFDHVLGRIVLIGGQTATGPSAETFSRQ